VMELIRGTGLDRLIRNRALSLQSAFRYLDGILAGLSAMHEVGVGHLDIKPGNVILRDGETPVLVDFGLSGRRVRPGCGTLEYCAPELLEALPENATPMATDMYAFACLAFEVLTAELLFDAEDDMSLIAAQLEHDGSPKKLRNFSEKSGCAELARALSECLAKDPSKRPSAARVRQRLAALTPARLRTSWPLGASDASVAELSA
jgi:eukaryotic-like serine/threonine-protein kinase